MVVDFLYVLNNYRVYLDSTDDKIKNDIINNILDIKKVSYVCDEYRYLFKVVFSYISELDEVGGLKNCIVNINTLDKIIRKKVFCSKWFDEKIRLQFGGLESFENKDKLDDKKRDRKRILYFKADTTIESIIKLYNVYYEKYK